MSRSALVLGSLFACACAADVVPGGPDASVADTSVVEVEVSPPAEAMLPVSVDERLEPDPPALPILTPCPRTQGFFPVRWRETPSSEDADAITVCDPWPEGGEATCAAGQAHFLGEAGCTPIGQACDPSDDYAIGLPPSGVLYVHPNAAPGGDGTRASPFASIVDATRAAPNGGVVALAKGAHVGSFLLGPRIQLWGACVTETVLTSTLAAQGATIVVPGSGVELRNLTVSGATAGVAIVRGASALLRDVLVTDTGGVAVYVEDGARGEASTIVIRNAGDDGFDTLGTLVLSRARIESTRGIGVLATGANANATLTDVFIADTDPNAVGDGGDGIQVIHGALAQVSRTLIVRSLGVGAIVAAGGSSAVFTDFIARDGRGSDGRVGAGMLAAEDARMSLSRVHLTANREGNLLVQRGAVADVEDVVLLDARTNASTNLAGLGAVANGATMTGGRILIERARQAGLVALNEGALDLTDVTVRRTAGLGVVEGTGLTVTNASTATVARATFAENRRSGVFVDFASRALLSDVTVRDTLPDAREEQSSGVTAISGSHAELRRAVIERNAGTGATAQLSSLRMTDVIVRDVTPDSVGLGIGVGSIRADTILERVLLERCTGGAILAHTAGLGTPLGSLMLEDVIVRDTRPSPDGTAGYAMGLEAVADVAIARAMLERHRGYGIISLGPTSGRIEDLTIRDVQPDLLDEGPGIGPVLQRGYGLALGLGTQLEVERVLIESTSAHGVILNAYDGVPRPATLIARDLIIRDAGADVFWKNGAGITVFGAGGLVTLERARIERTFSVGLYAENLAGGAPATITASDLVIEETHADMCDRCTSPRAAIGAGAGPNSAVELRRFSVSRSEICGVQVLEGGTMDLFDGTISDNPIGANVQAPAYDPARLARNVAYLENGIDLDATQQSSPDTSTIDLTQ